MSSLSECVCVCVECVSRRLGCGPLRVRAKGVFRVVAKCLAERPVSFRWITPVPDARRKRAVLPTRATTTVVAHSCKPDMRCRLDEKPHSTLPTTTTSSVISAHYPKPSENCVRFLRRLFNVCIGGKLPSKKSHVRRHRCIPVDR